MRTLLLGDSLTAWHDWSDLLGPHLNHGIPGDTTDGLLYRLQRSLSANPERVILMIGTNDLIGHTPLENVMHNYTRLLSELLGIEHLYVCSLPPVADAPHSTSINADIAAMNEWLKDQIWKYHFTYVDVYETMVDEHQAIRPEFTVDGVHLSDAGYDVWERLLKEALEDTE